MLGLAEGRGELGGEAPRGGTFRIALTTAPFIGFDAIDPALANTFSSASILSATCAHLLSYPDKPLPAGARLTPEVASAFPKISSNRRTYTFTLRTGFRFNTGERVTARSFARAINRVLAPATKSPSAEFFADIAGARQVLDGRASAASGIQARGNRLVIRLTQDVPDFLSRTAFTAACAVPAALPIDPEGVRAPLPGAGPYYVAQYVPGRRVVLTRNRFYRGGRPHHVNRFEVVLGDAPEQILDKIERGQADWGFVPNSVTAARAAGYASRYGINRSRFFVKSGLFLRYFVLNTAGQLFQNNVKLRQAVNFAIDRPALLRERGGRFAGSLTDQYLVPAIPGFRDAKIYPLGGPNLRRARALAAGNRRNGRAVLYTCSSAVCVSQAQIIKENLSRIAIEVEIRQFPGGQHFTRAQTRGEPFDIAWWGSAAGVPDPYGIINGLLDGRTIAERDNSNTAYFNSPKYNARMARAAKLTGGARYEAYGKLDVDIARNAAPFAAYAYDNQLTLVSARTGCLVFRPDLDLAAVCLKR